MKRYLVLGAALAALVAGCGDDDDGDGEGGSAGTAADDVAAYVTVSDVEAHAAIGEDVAEIKAFLEPAKEGGEVDFDQVGEIWAEGRNSKKDDGSLRTLAGFAEGLPVADRVGDALGGDGEARGLDASQRAQWIDKGISAALALKVLGELDAAAEKVDAGETDAEEGAPHNVDEAWAFYTAGGEGLVSTAEKRAADFGLEGQVSEPVLAALDSAQQAAEDGDAAALEAAREDARGALNRIFALATKKYLVEGVEDAVARAEGLAFSWGLVGLPDQVRKTVEAAFGEDPSVDQSAKAAAAVDAAAGELGIDGELPDYTG